MSGYEDGCRFSVCGLLIEWTDLGQAFRVRMSIKTD